MRKIIVTVMAALLLLGCATTPGFMYTDTAPVTNAPQGDKTGKATCRRFIAWTFGDCSVGGAMAEGNIDKVSTVDYKFTNILWIYRSYTTIVTGE